MSGQYEPVRAWRSNLVDSIPDPFDEGQIREIEAGANAFYKFLGSAFWGIVSASWFLSDYVPNGKVSDVTVLGASLSGVVALLYACMFVRENFGSTEDGIENEKRGKKI